MRNRDLECPLPLGAAGFKEVFVRRFNGRLATSRLPDVSEQVGTKTGPPRTKIERSLHF